MRKATFISMCDFSLKVKNNNFKKILISISFFMSFFLSFVFPNTYFDIYKIKENQSRER